MDVDYIPRSIVICFLLQQLIPPHLHAINLTIEIESYQNEYATGYISDLKIDTWPILRGLYSQIFKIVWM